MIAMLCAALAALAAPAERWSAGAMASFRTTPLRGEWGPERPGPLLGAPTRQASWSSESAVHAVGSWRRFTADVSAGSELGWRVAPRAYEAYNGWRIGARAGVRLLTGPAIVGEVTPLDASVGLGAYSWLVCCDSEGGSQGGRYGLAPDTVPVAYVADRIWLWEPVALDLRYEVPLARRGAYNTVSVGVVFAAWE